MLQLYYVDVFHAAVSLELYDVIFEYVCDIIHTYLIII